MRTTFIAVLFALALTACTGLGGEPQIVSTIPPQMMQPPTAEPVVDARPQSAPDLVQGETIYAARCVDCHGESGAGDGELAMNGQIPNPGNFTAAAAVAAQTPVDYFSIITNGNLENLMPPWGDELSAEERWATALYTYTLRYSEDQLAEGAEIYAMECARCHGESGLGDGPEADSDGRGMPNLADPATMVALSDDHLYTSIAEGAGVNMPAYEDELSEEQIRAVTAYVRTLSIDGEDAIAELPEPRSEAVAASNIVLISQLEQPTVPPQDETTSETSDTLTITGRVTNATAEGSVPANLPVELHIIDEAFEETVVEGATREDGSFVFEDVPAQQGNVYFVSTRYQDRNFAGAPFSADGQSGSVTAPVTIYEVTDDESVIAISTLVMQINPLGEFLEVVQEFQITNESDRLYVTGEQTDTGRSVVTEVTLPVGSVVVGLENEERFIVDEDAATVTDTRPLLPGSENRITLAYLLPYEDGAIVEFPFDFELSGPVLVLVSTDDVQLVDDRFERIGPQQVGDETYIAYGTNLTIPESQALSFELTGRAAGVGTSADPTVITSDLVPLLIGGFVVVVIVIIGAVVLLRRPTNQDGTLVDKLAREIADLDAQHEAGSINHDVYHQRRTELKTRMAALMNQKEVPA